MRRYAVGILAVLGLAVFVVQAEDFWVKKDWKQWNKDDCKKMLQNSPWTFKFAISQVQLSSALPGSSGLGQEGAGGENNLEVDYFVQDRSSIPVREAYIRELQIDGKYDKMDDAHKKSFDQQAQSFLDRSFDDVILIHVEYGSTVQTFERQLAEYWQSIREDTIPTDTFLINQKGDHIAPIRFISPKNGEYSFELYFPRMKSGEPIVQDGDKSFSIEFPYPAVGSQQSGGNAQGGGAIATLGKGRVLAEFKVEKMTWKGKPST
jgi:hypothetical protein